MAAQCAAHSARRHWPVPKMLEHLVGAEDGRRRLRRQRRQQRRHLHQPAAAGNRVDEAGQQRRQRQQVATRSFADAEAAEDHPEQIVGGEFAGDARQRLLRQTQFLGAQLQLLQPFAGAHPAAQRPRPAPPGAARAPGSHPRHGRASRPRAAVRRAAGAARRRSSPTGADALVPCVLEARRLDLGQIALVLDHDALDARRQTRSDAWSAGVTPARASTICKHHVGAPDLLPAALDADLLDRDPRSRAGRRYR